MQALSSSQVFDRSNCHNRQLATAFWSNRDMLRKTVVSNLDRRLYRRVDPSDILQETFIEAVKRLEKFLVAKPMSLVDWLRLLTKNKTKNANSFHLHTGKRSMKTERAQEIEITGATADDSTPSHVLIKKELLAKRKLCLNQLPQADQEIIRLRHEFQKNNHQVAIELGISEKAASKRYYRALKNLTLLMQFS